MLSDDKQGLRTRLQACQGRRILFCKQHLGLSAELVANITDKQFHKRKAGCLVLSLRCQRRPCSAKRMASGGLQRLLQQQLVEVLLGRQAVVVDTKRLYPKGNNLSCKLGHADGWKQPCLCRRQYARQRIKR